jgi:hypothetical protein
MYKSYVPEFIPTDMENFLYGPVLLVGQALQVRTYGRRNWGCRYHLRVVKWRADSYQPYLLGKVPIISFMTLAELYRRSLERNWGGKIIFIPFEKPLDDVSNRKYK